MAPSMPTSPASRRYRMAQASPLGGQPDTSWFNPYAPSQSQPNASLPPASVPYYSGSDIAKQYENNRNIEQNQGDMFQGYFGGQAANRFGNEQAAGAKANQLYGDLEQTPGYSQEEIDAMLGNTPDGNAYQNLLNTDYSSNYLTPEEQAQMQGNPYAPGQKLDPGILDNINSTANNMTTGAIGGAETKLNQNYGTLQHDLRGAVDPSKLGVSDQYSQNTDNVLTTTGNKVDTAAYNPELNMDQGYARQAGMTDQEVADTASMGGEAAGARYRSAVQDLDRAAAASGNSSPLAVAAMRAQLEDQGAVAGADATTQAQLAARGQQREAATGVENTRAAANQYKTNAQIGGAEQMGNLAQNALNTREGMRMAGEQDISNRNLGIAAQLGQVGNQNAQYVGNAQIDQANAYGNRGLTAGQYNQTMGYNAANTAEQNAANRAATIANNRQNVNVSNQGNQFNRGYQVNSTLSGANQNIANARIAGQNNLRNYYTGQQQYQGQQGDIANSNLLQNRQQTQTGRNQATQGSAAWELGNKQYGFGSNFARSFGGGLGGGLAKGFTGGLGNVNGNS